MTWVTRRYRFSASHRLHSTALSDLENLEVFGKCNNPFGHGHDYVLEVTVYGDIDTRTGRVVNPAELDAFVKGNVIAELDHKDLNMDVKALAGKVPTTEVLALEIDRMLRDRWPFVSSLQSVRILETRNNIFQTTGT